MSKNTVTAKKINGIEAYFKHIFGLMAGAVGVTALTVFIMIVSGAWTSLLSANGGLSATYYVITFGGLILAIWTQARIFSMKPSTAGWLLFLYSVLIGFGLTPMILASNGLSILLAIIIATIMFICMSLFGYKTVKDLSFLGICLFMGMIGLIIVGLVSLFLPLGPTFSTIVCLIGVLIFALFSAYDMQTLKNAYKYVNNETQSKQLAVLGALHMYISFIAMFEYLLGLMNRE
ncbi:MAG: Bax inhibitor-1/YccA family protein [Alphaproteobacteria bacterium]|nr:Bax inhibitor-1/YccA family protein [Alphaproteobacteria bacterium]